MNSLLVSGYETRTGDTLIRGVLDWAGLSTVDGRICINSSGTLNVVYKFTGRLNNRAVFIKRVNNSTHTFVLVVPTNDSGPATQIGDFVVGGEAPLFVCVTTGSIINTDLIFQFFDHRYREIITNLSQVGCTLSSGLTPYIHEMKNLVLRVEQNTEEVTIGEGSHNFVSILTGRQ